MMATIAKLRDKYDLHMVVERYLSDDENAEIDKRFLRLSNVRKKERPLVKSPSENP